MTEFRSSAEFSRKWISDYDFFHLDLIEGETWRDFDSFKGNQLSSVYQVSDKGRVRRIGGDFIRGSITYDGYHQITLSLKDSGGRSMSASAHSVVLTIFQGEPPEDMLQPTVQHINHDKLDNRLENLCWMSAFDNNQEGHARRAKIVDATGEHIFESQKFASKYIGRYEDYISECIKNGYKLTSLSGEEVEVYTEVNSEWIKYERPDPRNRNKCRLVRNVDIVDFNSYWECDRYLN